MARIDSELQAGIRDLIRFVDQVAGAGFAALTLYGRALSPEFAHSNQLARTVVVLNEIDLEQIRRLAEHGPALARRSIAAPLVLTPAFIEASRDTFPLELLEIQQQHLTIAGTDYFSRFELNPEHVRLQCERELKRIKMRMTQGLLVTAGHEALLDELEVDIGEHATRTLIGLLWLRGQRELLSVPNLVAASEKMAGRSLAGLRASLSESAEHGWREFQALYHDIEALAAIANA